VNTGDKDRTGGGGKAGSNPLCPICGRPRMTKYRPFCSSICAQRDLGNWLKGSYRIPTNEEPQDMDVDVDDEAEDGPDQED
jgi:endogenous inhibitor of DNA gyrase (YacG/DUF329 family)